MRLIVNSNCGTKASVKKIQLQASMTSTQCWHRRISYPPRIYTPVLLPAKTLVAHHGNHVCISRRMLLTDSLLPCTPMIQPLWSYTLMYTLTCTVSCHDLQHHSRAARSCSKDASRTEPGAISPLRMHYMRRQLSRPPTENVVLSISVSGCYQCGELWHPARGDGLPMQESYTPPHNNIIHQTTWAPTRQQGRKRNRASGR